MGVGGQHHNPAALPPGTHCTGGWVGPSAGQNISTFRKTLKYMPHVLRQWLNTSNPLGDN